MDAVTSNFETAEVDGEVEEMIIKYKLRQPPASCKAKWWTHFMRFGLTHLDKKNHAACKLCFAQKNYSKGSVSTKGGGTGGLVRHLKRHHLTEYEVLDGKSGEGDSRTTCLSSASGSIVGRRMNHHSHYLQGLHVCSLQYRQHLHHLRGYGAGSGEFCLQRASLKPEVAQRIMFVKENLHILRKHYRGLALADRDNDDFLVELEMSYLFGDNDDEDEDAEIDVGQNDE
jgi:hypothetical protein